MPVFKNDDKTIPGKYRPISLLSCVGKVMERATYKYIFNHIKNLIYEFQSGFLKGHSTVFQPLEIYHKVCSNLDDRISTILIFVIFLKRLIRSGTVDC